ncbi:lipid II:glycine glycyltransferase FemX [Robiginitalea aurantiaca]|uniref:GNAT family N-acetyltransferase n=1 Tax=Robiginitalea aurantiaca TaxID=3056915 RepID=A0ABT7WI11_9FLAO|nr:GNAT family N-acetyltransferase [Robiginitalea aurantiaca]MDM9632562.1 GNAT family N-acetyltransferase [Robiginitalea aurantiaca]
MKYIIESKMQLETLKSFIYYVEDTPKILMLFHQRPILVGEEETSYYDTISPYGYSGPMFRLPADPEIISAFWTAVDSWYHRNNIVSEFIRFSLNNNHLCYNGCIMETLATVRGKIVPEEVQFSNFKKKVRNNIRRAIKSELTSEIHFKEIPLKAILEFYKIYTDTLERHKAIKRYYFGLDYFKNLLRQDHEDNSYALAIIRRDGIPISVELLVLTRETVYSYLGGTDVAYFEYRPNDYLKYCVINWARDKGYKYYNLGGGQKANDSLYRYKKSFFPKDEDLTFYTGRKIINKEVYNSLVEEFCKSNKLPIPKSSDPCKGGFFPQYRIESI